MSECVRVCVCVCMCVCVCVYVGVYMCNIASAIVKLPMPPLYVEDERCKYVLYILYYYDNDDRILWSIRISTSGQRSLR